MTKPGRATRPYRTDLAYVHDVGFSDLARRAAPGLLRLFSRHRIRDGRVVEYGCGGGRLAEALIRAGYSVTGIDISPAMIRLARRRAPHGTFRVGSLTEGMVPPCRAIVAVGEVVSYVREAHPQPRRLSFFFSRAFGALEPGGLLVFDFPESAEGRSGHGARSGGGWSVEWRTTVARDGRALCRHIVTTRRVGGRTRRSTEDHQVRLYERQAMAAALAACGFRVAMHRSYGRARLLPGGVVCVAVKPPAPGSSRCSLASI